MFLPRAYILFIPTRQIVFTYSGNMKALRNRKFWCDFLLWVKLIFNRDSFQWSAAFNVGERADKWRLWQTVGTWSANRRAQDMEEENSYRCDYEGGAEAEAEAEAEAGLRCKKSRHIQLQRERHRRRMAQFVAAALLLLLCGVLAVFLTFRLERPCGCATDSQTKSQSDSQSSGAPEKLQHPQSAQRLPIAMLTVPYGNITNGKYLLWEHEEGRAYIDGGFRYYNGSLIVPRKGFYRVFLQTLYEIDTSHFVGKQSLVLSSFVTVYQQSYSKDLPLLTAEDTVFCNDYKKDNVDYVKKSLFTSGTFKLDTNDKLHVTSSHPDFMPKNEYQSFFGAQLVFDDWSDS
ncbi:tumor necrosis factor ligand superfamily member 15-like [Poecilia latipinna]|uniref:tumor necrosis factor ligand superfamily member 15-like n=1 Tax=Poecilia latipinna TaxID=48699 RepID=UPI00072E9BD2|nr:PREDICTED: tumor necrosis factor ligand superfamily member 15-like [Poecilia latipinna]